MSPQGHLSVSGSEGKPVPVLGAFWVRLTRRGLVQLSLWAVLLLGLWQGIGVCGTGSGKRYSHLEASTACRAEIGKIPGLGIALGGSWPVADD